MSDRSAFGAGLDLACMALNSHALKAQIAAFNIANVSTSSFKPARVELASGPEDQGVRVSAILREGTASSPDAPDRLSIREMAPEISGTDLAVEFTHLIEAKNSFAANARIIGVIEELGESLLNIKT